MPTSLRIPQETEKMIAKVAKKCGQTKTAYILNAVDEKLGLIKMFGLLPAAWKSAALCLPETGTLTM